MNDKPQIPDPELIDRIAMMIGSMRDVPEGFEKGFRECDTKLEFELQEPESLQSLGYRNQTILGL
jgi:hypothetical protein